MTRTPTIVAIAGPSCSGKSTLAHALVGRIPGAAVLALDSYYTDQRGANDFDIDVDSPGAIDSPLLVAHVRALSRGETVAVPEYDFTTHARTGRTRPLAPESVVIVEGLFALYWAEIRDVLTGAVFMTANDESCLSRRIERDTRERGRTRDTIIHQYERQVRPMFERHVAPTRRYADVVVSGTSPMSEVVDTVAGAIGRWAG